MLKHEDEFCRYLRKFSDLSSSSINEYIMSMSNDSEWASNEIILAVTRALGLRLEVHFRGSAGVTVVMEESGGLHVNLIYSELRFDGLIA
jgi:hypothetical protein